MHHGETKVTIRPAKGDERLAIAGVHVRAWQVAYRGLIDDGFLDRLMPEDRAGIYTIGSADSGAPETIVAAEGETVLGFAALGPSRDADLADAGEIYALYVDPPRWGTGIGRALLGESRRRLRARGFDQGILWVLEGNRGAEAFYRRDGWRQDGSRRQESPYGPVVTVCRYRRTLP